MPTLRSEFRAAVAATEKEIAEGVSFIKRFEAARSSKLGWGTYAATCRMAYVEGDPNPWARCEAEVCASADDLLMRLWQNEGDAWAYNSHVRVTTEGRYGSHEQSWRFEHKMHAAATKMFGLQPITMRF